VRAFKLTLRAAVWIISAVVTVSALIVLSTHAEMVILYGPQVARVFTWTAGAGIACALVASFGVRRLGRRP
jgi:hypothetical protein